MRWSFKVARIGGIEVRIHVTFFLLLAVFASFYSAQGGASGTLKVIVFFLLVFLCVLLHEFGHAFAAKALRDTHCGHHLAANRRRGADGTDAGKTGSGIGGCDCWPAGERRHCGRLVVCLGGNREPGFRRSVRSDEV